MTKNIKLYIIDNTNFAMTTTNCQQNPQLK